MLWGFVESGVRLKGVMSFKCRFGVLDVRGLGFRDVLCMSLVLVCGLDFENVVAGFSINCTILC